MAPEDVSALPVIDMQNDFVLPGALKTVPRIRRVLDAFRRAKRPAIHVVREHRPDGSDVEITRRDRFPAMGGFLLPGPRDAGL